MKVLVTAFEPFGGEPINAAREAVALLSSPEGIELCRLTVPTVFGLCTETVVRAMRIDCPDVIVCVGQAAGRAAITPERIAVNLRDARIPDNAGFQPVDEPVVPDGPAAYFSTLPIRDMTDAIRKSGVPAEISNTAGLFVCNDLFYGIRHAIDSEFPSVRGGFIHVPCTPEQTASYSSPVSSMKLSDIVWGLEAALSTLL